MQNVKVWGPREAGRLFGEKERRRNGAADFRVGKRCGWRLVRRVE